MNSAIRPTRAPMVLAPAVRLVEPMLLEPVQAPLLPWPTSVEQVAESVDIAPRVQRIVSQLTNAVIEVLCGRRALEHLEAHLRAPVYDLVGHLRGARLLPEKAVEVDPAILAKAARNDGPGLWVRMPSTAADILNGSKALGKARYASHPRESVDPVLLIYGKGE